MSPGSRVTRRQEEPRSRRGPLRLLPAAFTDHVQRPALLAWLGVGLALRLLLMPFTVSADLLAVYWRSHLIAHEGEVFSSYLVNMGAHYVHAASLRLFGWMLPDPDVIWTDPWWWSDSSALSSQVQLEISTAAWGPQALFALKVPYLLADLAAGLIILAIVATAGAALARRAWIFWMLSPIGLYATYAFGRYEVLAVVLVVAALWAVERERPWWGAILLGIAVTMRGYPLLLVPLFALLSVRGLARQAAWAALCVAPFGLVMATNRLLAGTVGELATLQDFHTGTTFLAYTVPVDGTGQFYVFIAFALAVYGLVAARVWGWFPSAGAGDPMSLPASGRRPVDDLWVWLLVLHAGMFALATFSAHYFAWFAPFVALALARRPQWRGVLPLHLLQVVVVLAIADTLGGPGTLLGLFEPVDPQLATSLPNLREAFLTSGRAEEVVGLLRTAFTVLTVLLVWPAVRELAADATEPRRSV